MDLQETWNSLLIVKTDLGSDHHGAILVLAGEILNCVYVGGGCI